MFIYFEREREREGGKEGEREPQAGPTLRAEPMGAQSHNCEIATWADTKKQTHWTDWATEVPRELEYFKVNSSKTLIFYESE